MKPNHSGAGVKKFRCLEPEPEIWVPAPQPCWMGSQCAEANLRSLLTPTVEYIQVWWFVLMFVAAFCIFHSTTQKCAYQSVASQTLV